MKSLLEADIARLGLEGVAWLTPYSQDMPRTMNALDCMVLPQVGTEAFGGVVIEAYACGKAVIASDLDGIPEPFAAGDYGRLIRPGSVDELAAAFLEQARKGPLDMPARLALHARVATRFSLETAATSLLECYRSLWDPASTWPPRDVQF